MISTWVLSIVCILLGLVLICFSSLPMINKSKWRGVAGKVSSIDGNIVTCTYILSGVTYTRYITINGSTTYTKGGSVMIYYNPDNIVESDISTSPDTFNIVVLVIGSVMVVFPIVALLIHHFREKKREKQKQLETNVDHDEKDFEQKGRHRKQESKERADDKEESEVEEQPRRVKSPRRQVSSRRLLDDELQDVA